MGFFKNWLIRRRVRAAVDNYLMKPETTYSWIFLSVAMSSFVEPAKFRDISMIADGINFAIPSHKELQTSLSWLQKRDLVVKQKNKYSLTAKGRELHARASSGSKYVSEVWKFIENELAVLLKAEIEMG